MPQWIIWNVIAFLVLASLLLWLGVAAFVGHLTLRLLGRRKIADEHRLAPALTGILVLSALGFILSPFKLPLLIVAPVALFADWLDERRELRRNSSEIPSPPTT